MCEYQCVVVSVHGRMQARECMRVIWSPVQAFINMCVCVYENRYACMYVCVCVCIVHTTETCRSSRAVNNRFSRNRKPVTSSSIVLLSSVIVSSTKKPPQNALQCAGLFSAHSLLSHTTVLPPINCQCTCMHMNGCVYGCVCGCVCVWVWQIRMYAGVQVVA